MSLRLRLIFIISLLFVSGMVLGLSFQIGNARQRVANEVNATATLTFELLQNLLLVSDRSNAEVIELLNGLSGLENARHLNISIIGDEQEQTPLLENSVQAPAWFVRLVESEPLEYVQALSADSTQSISIRTNPADEIEEVWEESKRFLLVLFIVLLVLNVILLETIRRWFKPVQQIVESIEDVEQGNFHVHPSQVSLPELKVIMEKLNHLNQVLSTSKLENDRLNKQSLSIQEEERRYLAQELHDEMGQSISAIKAIAFSIAERTRNLDGQSADGARNIGDIANHVRDHVRSMMSRLRPTVLDELGLEAALQQMVDDWNKHHADSFCTFSMEDCFAALPLEQHIHIYRIVQEALTNVSRHSKADSVQVKLYKDDTYKILVQDTGAGFEHSTVKLGMGLRGIEERARALGGRCDIESKSGEGCCIHIEFKQE